MSGSFSRRTRPLRLRTPLEAGAKAPGMVQRVPGEACPYGLAVAYRTGKAIKREGAGSIPAVPAPSRIFLQSAKSRANARDSFFMEARASLAHVMAHARGSGLTGLVGQQGLQQRLDGKAPEASLLFRHLPVFFCSLRSPAQTPGTPFLWKPAPLWPMSWPMRGAQA